MPHKLPPLWCLLAIAKSMRYFFAMKKIEYKEIFSQLTAVEWAAIRYSRENTTYRMIRNDKPERNTSALDEGVMVEVLVNGHIGYAATADMSREGILKAFEKAIATTKSASNTKVFPFTSAQRPAVKGQYKSPRKKSLNETSVAEITDALIAGSQAMKISDLIVNRVAYAMLIETDIEYYSSNGTELNQNFEMVELRLAATAVRGTESQTRSYSKSGQWGGEVFDKSHFAREGARVAKEAVDLLIADNCPEGVMDILLMPDQMMLQIHESIGHPLEIDRILGDERNYAGWSFVKKSDFGTLQYGSKLMNITFDPSLSQEFASYAFDDGGNPATKEFLIKDGVLLRGLGSLESQIRSGLKGVANFRSASWNRAPIDRMANINLEPGSATVEEMISKMKRGIIMTTNRSWSIDDYRNKFQFGCEYGQLVENGKIVKIVKNPNYRGVTIDFWSRLTAVGKAGLSEAHGTPYCGKGEPSQAIRVGHASPPCLFKDVEVFGGQS